MNKPAKAIPVNSAGLSFFVQAVALAFRRGTTANLMPEFRRNLDETVKELLAAPISPDDRETILALRDVFLDFLSDPVFNAFEPPVN